MSCFHAKTLHKFPCPFYKCCVGTKILLSRFICWMSSFSSLWKLLLTFPLHYWRAVSWIKIFSIQIIKMNSRSLFLQLFDRVTLLIKLQAVYNFIKKWTLAQVFSSEFCEISKNTFCYRTPPVAASETW